MAYSRSADFHSERPNVDGPADGAFAITPHASTELTIYAKALYIGGAGSVVVVPKRGDGTEVTFAAVPAGTILPIQVRRVDDSSTATNIVGLYDV